MTNMTEAERLVDEATADYVTAMVAHEKAQVALREAAQRLEDAQRVFDERVAAKTKSAPRESAWGRAAISLASSFAPIPRTRLEEEIRQIGISAVGKALK